MANGIANQAGVARLIHHIFHGADLHAGAKKLTLPYAVILLTGLSTAVHAEPGSDGSAQTPRTLDKLVAVTEDTNNTEGSASYAPTATASATGLNLSLRETPQSVTVITRQRLDDQAMTTLFDALRSAPGVSVQPVDRGRSTLTARGFEINNYQFDGTPTVLAYDNNANTVMFDRIEVVRGATGLLSGAGDPSASVNMVRKHANSHHFTGAIDASVGSWNQRGVTVDVTTPLNEAGSVRARWVAYGTKQDAFIDLESSTSTVLYGVIDADLSDATRISLGASDQRDKRYGVLWAGLPYWYSDGTRTNWDRSKTTATNWNRWDVTQKSVFASLEHTLQNRWKIRSDASFIQNNDEEKMLWMWGDPDRTTGLGMQSYPYHYLGKPKQLSFNLVVSGPFTLWNREQDLSAGLMFSRARDEWSNRDAAAPDPAFPVGDINHWDGSYPEPAFGPRYAASYSTTTQRAGYAALRLQITDPLKVILGARVSDWKLKDEASAWTAATVEIHHRGEITPYAGVVYTINTQLSAYGSYTSIFNPQRYRNRNGDYLDPLEGNSYEGGIKAEFFGGMLNASAALFRTDQKNFASPDVGYTVPGTIEQAYVPAQGVIAQGYELEMVGELRPDWSISLGWTSYSAKDAQQQDVAVDHPRQQLKLFTKVVLPGNQQRWSIGGGVNWDGAQPATATNPGTGLTETIGQPSYALVELMARYAFSTQWSAQVNVGNALDKHYVSRNTGWWGGPYTYGAPRNWRAELTYQFE